LVRESARYEDLGKTRIRDRRLARVPRSGSDEIVDHLSGALHALHRDAAAASIAQEETSCLGKLRRIGGLGYTDAHQQKKVDRDGESWMHLKLPIWFSPKN
jgi:hypothetical protein